MSEFRVHCSDTQEREKAEGGDPRGGTELGRNGKLKYASQPGSFFPIPSLAPLACFCTTTVMFLILWSSKSEYSELEEWRKRSFIRVEVWVSMEVLNLAGFFARSVRENGEFVALAKKVYGE